MVPFILSAPYVCNSEKTDTDWFNTLCVYMQVLNDDVATAYRQEVAAKPYATFGPQWVLTKARTAVFNDYGTAYTVCLVFEDEDGQIEIDPEDVEPGMTLHLYLSPAEIESPVLH